MNFTKIRKFQLVLEITENKGYFEVNIVKIIMHSKYKEFYKLLILSINSTMSYVCSEDVNCYYLVKNMNLQQLKQFEMKVIEIVDVFL